ncbi:hypothetical protein LguiB_018019 [Lonicera macranthoides]
MIQSATRLSMASYLQYVFFCFCFFCFLHKCIHYTILEARPTLVKRDIQPHSNPPSDDSSTKDMLSCTSLILSIDLNLNNRVYISSRESSFFFSL